MKNLFSNIAVTLMVVFLTGVMVTSILALQEFAIIIAFVAAFVVAPLWVLSSANETSHAGYDEKENQLKVLIIDDDLNSTRLLQKALTTVSKEIQIDVAAGGKRAIHQIASKDYDLIFIDHEMPEYKGPDIIKLADYEISQHSAGMDHRVPVITYTAHKWNDWNTGKLNYINIAAHLSKGSNFHKMKEELSSLMRTPLQRASDLSAA